MIKILCTIISGFIGYGFMEGIVKQLIMNNEIGFLTFFIILISLFFGFFFGSLLESEVICSEQYKEISKLRNQINCYKNKIKGLTKHRKIDIKI